MLRSILLGKKQEWQGWAILRCPGPASRDSSLQLKEKQAEH
jgi:hypothetical protein